MREDLARFKFDEPVNIIPYESIGPFRFGDTTVEECRQFFVGTPKVKGSTFLDEEMYRFQNATFSFEKATGALAQAGLWGNISTRLLDLDVTWNTSFVEQLRASDPRTFEGFGTVISPKFGVMLVLDDSESIGGFVISAFSHQSYEKLRVRLPELPEPS